MGGYAMPVTPEFAYMQGMTEQQQMLFMAQYNIVRKDTTAAILLAFFLGSFGAHRFYLGDNTWGIIYLLLCWTAIPGIVALVECFLLPGRVQEYNGMRAAMIAEQIRGTFELAPYGPGVTA